MYSLSLHGNCNRACLFPRLAAQGYISSGLFCVYTTGERSSMWLHICLLSWSRCPIMAVPCYISPTLSPSSEKKLEANNPFRSQNHHLRLFLTNIQWWWWFRGKVEGRCHCETFVLDLGSLLCSWSLLLPPWDFYPLFWKMDLYSIEVSHRKPGKVKHHSALLQKKWPWQCV